MTLAYPRFANRATTLWVEADGSDTTGQRGNPGRPYLTLGAALAACQSGDTILIGPGTFSAAAAATNSVTVARLSIIGAGITKTILKNTNASGRAIRAEDGTTKLESLEIADMTLETTGASGIALLVNGSNLATNGFCVSLAYDDFVTGDGLYLRNLLLKTTGGSYSMNLICLGFVRMDGVDVESGNVRLAELYDCRARNCTWQGTQYWQYDNDVAYAPDYLGSPLAAGYLELHNMNIVGNVDMDPQHALAVKAYDSRFSGTWTITSFAASQYVQLHNTTVEGEITLSCTADTATLKAYSCSLNIVDITRTSASVSTNGEFFNCQIKQFDVDGTNVNIYGCDYELAIVSANGGTVTEVTSKPASGITSVPRATTVYLDKSGNDSTGTRGDASKPYLTLPAALAACSDGDVLEIGAGEWVGTGTLIPNALVDFTMRGKGEGVTIISSVGTYCLQRSSSTALDSLRIERMTISCSGGVPLYLTGTGATPDGYFLTEPGLILRQVRFTPNTTADDAIQLVCLGYVYVEDCRFDGVQDYDEIGVLTLRNADGNTTGDLQIDFTAGTLPNGFTECIARLYSAKAADVTVTGIVELSTDASCQFAGALAMTGATGALIDVVGNIDGLITVDGDTNVISVAADNNANQPTVSKAKARWTEIFATDYTAEPAATDEVTLGNTALLGPISAGTPLLWLAAPNVGARGTKGNSAGIITGENITGVTMDHLKAGGALIIEVVEDADPMYHLNLYDSEAKDNLIAHTISFNDTAGGAQALVEDNSSGIGGTLTIGAGTCVDGVTIAAICAWACVVDTITENAGDLDVTILGRPFVTGSDTILGLWYGKPEMVNTWKHWGNVSMLSNVSDTVLASYCYTMALEFDQSWSHLVGFRFAIGSYSSAAKVNMITDGQYLSTTDSGNGPTVNAAATWFGTAVDINPQAVLVGHGNTVEFAVTSAGTGSYPTIELFWVTI